MGIKISELPQQTTLADEFQFPMIDDTPETKRVGFDVLYSSINVIPYSTFNNGSNDITLGNWGLQDASGDCGEIFTVNLPNPGDFTGKILILRNQNDAITIPISGIVELDGTTTTTLGTTRCYICFSNGSDWLVISYAAA